MRIALIYPAVEFDLKYHPSSLPLGLLYLAACAEQQYGATVDVFDSRHGEAIPSPQQVDDYDLIGFTAMSMQVKHALRLASKLRESGYRGPLAFGGPHASVAPDHLKVCNDANVNAIFSGEAEVTFLKYLAYLEGKPQKLQRVWVREKDGQWTFYPGAGFIEDLDTIPFPAREKYENVIRKCGFVNTFSTRGCPFSCNYCQPTKRIIFGDRVRRRSIDNIVAEIQDSVNRFEIGQFCFDDDTFTFQKKHVMEMCERLKPLRLKWSCQSRSDVDRETLTAMRDAGCYMILVGAESGSQRVLDLMNKRNTVEKNAGFIRTCKELGILTWCNMMLGYPGETRKDMEQSLQFLIDSKPDMTCVSQVTAFPGTELCQKNPDDVIEVDWDDMARHVRRPKFRSMARYQKIIDIYTRLMSKDFDTPLGVDLLGSSRISQYLARRSVKFLNFSSRSKRRFYTKLSEALSDARGGKLPEAIRQLEELTARYPHMHDALGHLAWLYLSSGRRNEAASTYARLCVMQPNNVEALYQLGKTLLDLGRREEAEEALRKAVSLEPGHQAAQLLGS